MDPIKRGDIALCSRGELGLITCDYPHTVTYDDGTVGCSWTGIYLSRDRLGDKWSARNPIVVGNIHKVMFYNDELNKNWRREKLNGKR